MAHMPTVIQRRHADSGQREKVAGINRNRWPLSPGIRGQFEPEPLATLGRNMQRILI